MPPRSHITAQAALAATVPPSVAERPRSSRRLALFLAAGVLAFGAVLVVTRLVRTGSPSATRDAVTADVPASRPQLDATEPFDAAVDVPADAAIAIDAGHRPDAGRPHVIDAGRPHVIDARPLVLNGGVDAAVPLVLPPKLPDAGVAPAPDAGFIEPGFHSTKARDAGP